MAISTKVESQRGHAWFACRCSETMAGICPAISGAIPVPSVLRAPGWILMSLLNPAQSSKITMRCLLYEIWGVTT